jgi:CO/xanthine dehydrogenase Mo-binding subunit/aerobic-type carbon monoxide dehydrogenase small subunit (CoxS/CutS family)
MRFILNGRSVSVEAPGDRSLLAVLRGDLGLRSMKDGCAPEGSCGACTVIVDGRAVVSCARAVERIEGRVVETLEGLPAATRELWAAAFTATGASQCGFCSPGIVMKAEALLRHEPAPDRPAIARALAGNLCRCTGYASIVDAISLVAAVRRGEAEMPSGPAAADRMPRIGAAALALGEQPFVADMTAPGMLHGALRFADHPRAIVRRIDVAAALAHRGVVDVVTWRDVPGRREQGLIVADWPLLVAEGETTRYLGDVLAAVAAETREAAREAAALVEVDYEPLPPVTDPFEALEPDAPRIHEAGNLLSLTRVRRGDAERALATATHVASATFRTQSIEHAYLEPEACLAVPADAAGVAETIAGLAGAAGAGAGAAGAARGPRVHVHSQGQGAWEDRRQIASFLGLEERDVLVTQVPTGGAFGGKEDLGPQGQAALLAIRTGRPVLLALSRADSIRFHPKRHRMWLDYTAGCDAEGHLVAVRARIVGDNGAYASVGGKVLERAAGHACGAYKVPNVDVEARAVHTNRPPSGAMRGFGANQSAFAIEGMLDVLAERVGIDGWEIRWRNALETGDRFGTGQRLGPGVGLKKTLLAVRDAYRGARYAGIACGAKNTGIGNGLVERGRAVLRPAEDGTVELFHSWTEMGQGVHTVLAGIAARELGLPAAAIHVSVDTSRELDTGETTASRATMLGGRAVVEACRTLREALGDGRLEDLAGREFRGEVVVDWTTSPDDDVEEPVTHFGYGWATQVVILGEDGRIERVVAAHDVGHVLDRTLLEGQVVGGVHMGLGMALTESFVVRDGVPMTDTLKSLGIIPPAGMPPVETILVEEPQPEGPYGAKGMGEAVLVPTAAAVAAALHSYDGVRRTTLPMRDSAAARAALPRVDGLPAERKAEAGPGELAATAPLPSGARP